MAKDEGDPQQGMDLLARKIEKLEETISRMLNTLSKLSDSGQKYAHLVSLYLEYGEISPSMVLPNIQDPISKVIISVLSQQGSGNVSQITDWVRDRRGKASRKTVKDRLDILIDQDIIVRSRGKGRVTYSLSPEVIRKCAKMLGLNI